MRPIKKACIKKLGGGQILQIIALDALLVLIPLAFIISQKKSVAAALCLRSGGLKKDAVQGALLFAMLVAAGALIVVLLSMVGLNDLGLVEGAMRAAALQAPYVVVYLAVVRPLAEELFFRGFLATKTGPWIQALLYAALHSAYGSVAEIVGAFVMGALLGVYFLRNKTLIPNILAHWAYNLLAIAMILV